MTRVVELGQYPTPCWLAEAVVARYFPDLDASDVVLDPTAGRGHFLASIPAHVPAFGVELDPLEAELGRIRSGREIVLGDVRTVELALRPTAIVGNPPFQTKLVDRILERAFDWLPDGGRVGFILPTAYFQTASRLLEHRRRWSIAQEMIPRNAFDRDRANRLRHTLCFALFSKDRRRTLVGFAFYGATAAWIRMAEPYRRLASEGGILPWRAVVVEALAALGGEATLERIYAVVEGKRPTSNRFWREKIRQTLQLHCVRVERGRYALPRRVA